MYSILKTYHIRDNIEYPYFLKGQKLGLCEFCKKDLYCITDVYLNMHDTILCSLHRGHGHQTRCEENLQLFDFLTNRI